MAKPISGEFVLMFKENGVPVGFLYENGQREIYECKRATKERVADLLEVDKVEPPHVSSSIRKS